MVDPGNRYNGATGRDHGLPRGIFQNPRDLWTWREPTSRLRAIQGHDATLPFRLRSAPANDPRIARCDIEPFRQATPSLFIKLVPADWFVLVDAAVDMRNRRVSVFDWWESSKVMSDDVVQRMRRTACDHPFSRYSLQTGDRTALKLSDFYSVTQLRRSELYNEFYRHAGIGRSLAAASLHRGRVTTFNAARPLRAPDFTERDRLMLNLLRPHFEQARRSAERNSARAAARPVPIEVYGLTPREREVAVWLAKGKTNLEIGLILQAATRTVEKHVERILAKLGVENRAAAALALRDPTEC